jgi:signal transduction histidine kinase
MLDEVDGHRLRVRPSLSDPAPQSDAIVELEALVPMVATVDTTTLRLAVDRANAEGRHQITVFLPGGQVIGTPARRSAAVKLAMTGRSLAASAPGGREVVVAVAGLEGGTAVIRSFVPGAELRRGVGHAWMIIILLGLGLLVVSVLVAQQLARSLTRPLTTVADVSYRLAQGDLSARAPAEGPSEVRQVSVGLNLLAARIGELLAAEREMVADLSHRLRTPLTALRIDAESMGNPDDQSRLTADLDAVERTVDAIIREARRPVRHPVTATCDAVEVVAERAEFWSVLAEEEGRPMEVQTSRGPLPVTVGHDDLAACVDVLLGNVFTHTPEGCAMGLRLTPRPDGGAVLVMADAGKGLPDTLVVERGHSGNGSTGLGLDIVRRVATGSGGALTLGRAPIGGAMIVMEIGGPPPMARRRNRHRASKRPLLGFPRSRDTP